jgi:hypothetical protein
MSQVNVKETTSGSSNVAELQVLAKESSRESSRILVEEGGVYKILDQKAYEERGISVPDGIPRFTSCDHRSQLKKAGYDKILRGTILEYGNKLLFVYRLRDTDSFQWLKEKNFEKVLGEDEAARFKRDFASASAGEPVTRAQEEMEDNENHLTGAGHREVETLSHCLVQLVETLLTTISKDGKFSPTHLRSYLANSFGQCSETLREHHEADLQDSTSKDQVDSTENSSKSTVAA